MTAGRRVNGRPPGFDVRSTVGDLSTEHLQCRDFGHSWRPYTATWSKADKAYEVTLRCARCKTRRRRLIGQRGELIANAYDYADNYLIQGMGRLSGTERDLVRLESVLRVLPDDALDDDDED